MDITFRRILLQVAQEAQRLGDTAVVKRRVAGLEAADGLPASGLALLRGEEFRERRTD